MAIELRAAYDFLHDELKARRGPALSFSRASPAWEYKKNTFWAFHDDDQPRFWGGHTVSNKVYDSTDLSGAAWTVDGVTVTTGQTDPEGRTEAAILTEDTTTGFHGLSQDSKTYSYNEYGGTYVNYEVWFKKGGDNPARYVFLSWAGFDGQFEMMCVDLDLGVITDGAETYSWSSGAGSGDAIYYHGNGWWRAQITGNAQSAATSLMAFGFSPDGTNASTAAGYAGTGKTVIVAHPQADGVFEATGQEKPWMNHIPSGAATPGQVTVRQEPAQNLVLNSELIGYTGKGDNPQGIGWGHNYEVFVEGTTTGNAEVVDSTLESAKADNTYSSRGVWGEGDVTPYCNAVHCWGTNQQYFLNYDTGQWAAGARFGTRTVCMHIDDVVTAPTGPVLAVTGFVGATGDLSALISERDANGWIKVVFTMASTTLSDYGIYHFGLGADGVNDTGDFTWSMPMVLPGDWSNIDIPAEGFPSNNWTWGAVPVRFLPGYGAQASRGLRIERTQTNLITSSELIGDAAWTYTGSAQVLTNGTFGGHTGLLASHYMRNVNAGGSGVSTISQNITFETSERYELCFDSFPGTSARRWQRLQVTGLGALTFSTYFDPKHWQVAGDPAFGTTVGFTEEEATWGWSGQVAGDEQPWNSHCRVSFTSDAADTTGTVVIGAANADLDDTILFDDTDTLFYAKGVQLTKGYINTPIISPDGLTGTRAADILTTSDVTGIPTSGGLIYVKFRTARGVGYDQKTILSLSDGTANERIELAIDTSSNLVLTVIDGGVSQAAVTGATTIADDTVYEVAIYYDTNDFQMYLDGVVEGTPDTSGTLPTFTQFNLGSDWNDVNQLDGHLQEVKVYANALGSIAEISNGTYVDPASGIASSPRGLTRDLTRSVS